MVTISKDNKACVHRVGNRCQNERVANAPVVNDSLQSKWYCSNCPYYSVGTF